MKTTVSIAVVALLILVGCGESNREHELDGSVLIFQDANFTVSGSTCNGTGDYWDLAEGSPVKVTPQGKDPVFTFLSVGSVTPEGNCRLKFTPTIPEASSYTFEVGGRLPVVRQKAAIDGSIGGRDDWWVTLDYDYSGS